jgi:arylsulfatase A-like enzyme
MKTIFLSLALLLCSVACLAQTDKQPNVVFIYSDQQHYQALGSVDDTFDTPNMDTLAASSVVFEHSFTTSPQCSPSRASIMTGLYPHKAGMMGNVGSAGGTELALPTIGKRLQDAGYVTGFMGKWHLGDDPAGNAGWEKQATRDHDTENWSDSDTTEHALTFLDEHAKGDRPLFMFLMYNDPHDIYYFQNRPDRDPAQYEDIELGDSWHKEDLAAKPWPQLAYMEDNQGQIIHGREKEEWLYYRDYYRQKVKLVDDEVGRVITRLKEKGMWENTIIVYSSDHGDMDTNHRMIFKGPFMYEHMIRVPTMIRVPPGLGGVAPYLERRYDWINVDLLPTVMDLVGLDVPEVDGISFKPLLTGGEQGPAREFVVTQYYSKQQWVNPIRSIRSHRFKYNLYVEFGEELYDLVNDPEELVNLAEDSEYSAVKADLRDKLDNWMEENGDDFYAYEVTEMQSSGPIMGQGDFAHGATFTATKVAESEVDPLALTIDGRFGQSINGNAFQQDAVASHNGFQYVAYYDARRQVCLARRELPLGEWQVIRFDDYHFEGDDAHNTISIGIAPVDGTIHMAFDHHVHPLHYRVSKKGVATQPDEFEWQASLFSAISSSLTGFKGNENILDVTYPRFFQTPVGGLQFRYRRHGSGNGDNMMVDYDANTGTWSHYWQIDSGEGVFKDSLNESPRRNAYTNGYDYGPDGKLHTTWVWREQNGNGNAGNHDLMYAFSTNGGRSWKNNEGQMLERPPFVHSPGITVAQIGRQYGLMNTHGQAVDSRGRVHVVMWHSSDESLARAGSFPGEYRWGPAEARRYHHYWRDENGQWDHQELPMVVGSRPKVFIDTQDNIFLIYGQPRPGTEMARGIYFKTGDLVIAAASAGSDWSDWQIIHTEDGPFGNEMLGDFYRWKNSGVLSIMVQDAPKDTSAPASLRVLDFSFKKTEEH